jgi:GNAT superfamily N-acetyltransferase
LRIGRSSALPSSLPSGYLLLDNVAVLPAAQGRGIGARLLALADEQARSLGLGEIRLYTNEAITENLAY